MPVQSLSYADSSDYSDDSSVVDSFELNLLDNRNTGNQSKSLHNVSPKSGLQDASPDKGKKKRNDLQNSGEELQKISSVNKKVESGNISSRSNTSSSNPSNTTFSAVFPTSHPSFSDNRKQSSETSRQENNVEIEMTRRNSSDQDNNSSLSCILLSCTKTANLIDNSNPSTTVSINATIASPTGEVEQVDFVQFNSGNTPNNQSSTISNPNVPATASTASTTSITASTTSTSTVSTTSTSTSTTSTTTTSTTTSTSTSTSVSILKDILTTILSSFKKNTTPVEQILTQKEKLRKLVFESICSVTANGFLQRNLILTSLTTITSSLIFGNVWVGLLFLLIGLAISYGISVYLPLYRYTILNIPINEIFNILNRSCHISNSVFFVLSSILFCMRNYCSYAMIVLILQFGCLLWMILDEMPMTTEFYVSAFIAVVATDITARTQMLRVVVPIIINVLIYSVIQGGVYYWKRKIFFETWKWQVITFVTYIIVELIASILMVL